MVLSMACLALQCIFMLSAFGLQGNEAVQTTSQDVKIEFQWNGHVHDKRAEAAYLLQYADTPGSTRKRASHNFRPGHSTTSNSCDNVRGVPSELRSADVMRPDGLDNFYQKYTEAYGIPILASATVSDDALKRACYTVRFMFADHSGIRESVYRMSGRFAIIGDNEVTKDIPEFHNIDDYMNNRTRGLGAMVSNPVSTGAEENILCESQDRWHPEDIFLHEVAHTVDNLGATMVIPGWHQDLQKVYDHAKAAGLWDNTYAMTDPDEYFAEGVQSFFNVNDRATPTNGIHNDVDTQAELKLYDRELYDLILTVFPCNNHYLKRCESTRQEEQSQHLKMDCNTDHTTFPDTSNGHDGCQDEQTVECIGWAIDGECEANPSWMLNHCKASCKTCPSPSQPCSDSEAECPGWATSGECHSNPEFMLTHCRYSCDNCDGPEAPCSNSNINCTRWAAEGQCHTNSEFMMVHCKFSCNNCDVKTNATVPPAMVQCTDMDSECADWANTGECHNNPEYMLVHCKFSCDNCDDPSKSGQCADDNDNCPDWASNGECHNNPGYMLIHCKRSCGNCDGRESLIGR